MVTYEQALKKFSEKGTSPGEIDWVGKRAMMGQGGIDLSGESPFKYSAPEDILQKQTAQTIDMSAPSAEEGGISKLGEGAGAAASGGGGFSLTPNLAMAIGQMAIGGIKDIHAANQARIMQDYQNRLQQYNANQANLRAMANISAKV